jgi:hypothetical protein
MSPENSEGIDPRFPHSEKVDPMGHALAQIDAAFELGEAYPEVVSKVLDDARKQARRVNGLDR